jgi:hypothetical protein
MSTHEIRAIFSSAEAAHAALRHLRALGIDDAAMRIEPQCGVHVQVSADLEEAAGAALRESGALDVNSSDGPEGGWMSHQNGRVTGTGVDPGAGDAEAGMPPE